ncbi:MAG: DNA recombination protein RmuC [Candidatus Omnitrophica bacterium]|nr:DNA recombination protein RmuC [Candidatus Omnitrophota bacterium]
MNLVIVLLFLNLLGVIFLLSRRVPLLDKFDALEKNQQRTETVMKDEIARFRSESTLNARQDREEIIKTLEGIRQTVQNQLKTLQSENSSKLEQMRLTVDEKLHDTLEKRLGEKFNLVSRHLESVQKGLGEMQALAVGVGDLKKVLTNVKTRGTWGEVQLGTLLEQILTSDQYKSQVRTKKGSKDVVDFAIKLPGRDGSDGVVWLPIDAKFPQEDYQRLLVSQEAADKEACDKCLKQLELKIKLEAKEIKGKYIDPPNTTDFGIMFLPTEGLYAEVLRIPGLCDLLQRDYRIIVAGPTTLAALLNSLQMGFRTLAVEKRSSEVWQLLGIIKTEFFKFGAILDKTKEKLDQASKTIDTASSKQRNIEKKLNKVQQLPRQDEPQTIELAIDD